MSAAFHFVDHFDKLRRYGFTEIEASIKFRPEKDTSHWNYHINIRAISPLNFELVGRDIVLTEEYTKDGQENAIKSYIDNQINLMIEEFGMKEK